MPRTCEANCIDKHQSISRKHAETSCSMTGNQGLLLFGPVWPHDKMEFATSVAERGCCAASVAYSNKQRSIACQKSMKNRTLHVVLSEQTLDFIQHTILPINRFQEYARETPTRVELWREERVLRTADSSQKSVQGLSSPKLAENTYHWERKTL